MDFFNSIVARTSEISLNNILMGMVATSGVLLALCVALLAIFVAEIKKPRIEQKKDHQHTNGVSNQLYEILRQAALSLIPGCFIFLACLVIAFGDLTILMLLANKELVVILLGIDMVIFGSGCFVLGKIIFRMSSLIKSK